MISNRWLSYCLISNDYVSYFNNKIYFVNRKFHFSFFRTLSLSALSVAARWWQANLSSTMRNCCSCFFSADFLRSLLNNGRFFCSTTIGGAHKFILFFLLTAIEFCVIFQSLDDKLFYVHIILIPSKTIMDPVR